MGPQTGRAGDGLVKQFFTRRGINAAALWENHSDRVTREMPSA